MKTLTATLMVVLVTALLAWPGAGQAQVETEPGHAPEVLRLLDEAAALVTAQEEKRIQLAERLGCLPGVVAGFAANDQAELGAGCADLLLEFLAAPAP